MRFAIVGMGGIGGFVGAMLCKAGIDTAFVARGEQLRSIAKNGLTLKSDAVGETFSVRPRIVTDDPREIGEVDAVIVAVKGYSLDETVDTLSPMIAKDTLILPLLNGVGIGERIAKRLNEGIVLDGLIYVSAYIEAPGTIAQIGSIKKIVLGAPHNRSVDPVRLDALASALIQAGIDAVHEPNIQVAVWTKYMFITAFGSATSYFGCTAGGLWQDAEKSDVVRALCDEIAAVAAAKGVLLPDGTIERNIETAKGLPHETKSSLQRDLETPGKPNELEQFSGEVVRLGMLLGVPTPVNRRVYDALRLRSQAAEEWPHG